MTDISRGTKWAAIIAAWVVLGLIWAGPIYLETHLEEMGHSPFRVFSWGILIWLGWAPLTPVMIWLARRYSLIGGAWKSSLLVHLPAFLLISIVHSAAATAITLIIRPFDDMGSSPEFFLPRFLSRIPGSFGSDLLVYGGVIGICYALDYYHKYR